MKLSVNEAKLTGFGCRIQTLMVGGEGGEEAVFKKFVFSPSGLSLV